MRSGPRAPPGEPDPGAGSAPRDGTDDGGRRLVPRCRGGARAPRADPGGGDRDREPLVRGGDRGRRPRPPVRDGPLADAGRGDVPALRLVSRVQPDRRAVDDVPHPGGGGERPAAGDVHRAHVGPGRGHPVELPVRPARRDDRVLGERPDGRPRRDGEGRASAAACGSSPSRPSPSRCPSEPEPAAGQRLLEVADLVLDLCSPKHDATVRIDGLDTPVGPAVHDRRGRHRQRHQGPGPPSSSWSAGPCRPSSAARAPSAPSGRGSCSTKPIESMRGDSPVRSASKEVGDAQTSSRDLHTRG